MAQISKKDLDVLSNQQIKDYFNRDKTEVFNVSPIKEYLENCNIEFVGSRAARISNILTLIILERFLSNKL